ncbi:MAG: hypothetical protein B7Y24_00115 [Sphingobacteriales bacterium 16-39-50]|nr:MAG: hypothetical protein B7Y24_00115 [Sphingobacteriales bacterium 16-39-50]
MGIKSIICYLKRREFDILLYIILEFKMIFCNVIRVFIIWKPTVLQFFIGSPAFRSYSTGLNHRPVSATIGFKHTRQ